MDKDNDKEKNILQRLKEVRENEKEVKKLKDSDFYKLNEEFFPGQTKYSVIEAQPKIIKKIHEVSDDIKAKIKAKWKVAVAVLVAASITAAGIGVGAKQIKNTNDMMDAYGDFIEYANTFDKEINAENYADYMENIHGQVDPSVYLENETTPEGLMTVDDTRGSARG